jgi:hypothetical protein
MHVGTAVHVPPQRVGEMFPHKSILIQRQSFVGANLRGRPPAKMKFLAYPGAWGCGRARPPVAFLPLASRVEQPNISQHVSKSQATLSVLMPATQLRISFPNSY